MEFKRLVKNTSFLISTKFVQFLSGLIRSKINAILLGTNGVGVFSQMAFVTNRMYQLTTMGMGEAVVKQIAGNQDDTLVMKQTIERSLKSYVVLSSLFLLVTLVLFVFFTEELTHYVFGESQYQKYLLLGILAVPILVINSIPFSILRSFKNVRAISRARIFIIIINFVLYLPFVFLYKLDGAAVYLPISFIVTTLVNFWFAKKLYLNKYNITFASILRTPMVRNISKEILVFSGFGLALAIYGIFYELFSRSLVVTHLGIDKIGVYSPIIKWFGLFTGFIMPSFSTYLFPRYSEVKSNEELTGIINDSLRLCTFMMLPLLLIAIPYRKFFIQLFYSKEFLEAAVYLPYHFYGKVFFIWFTAMVISFKPTGGIKYHAAFYFILYTINIGLSYWLIPRYGLYGLMLSSTVGGFILFLMVWNFIICRNQRKVQWAQVMQ